MKRMEKRMVKNIHKYMLIAFIAKIAIFCVAMFSFIKNPVSRFSLYELLVMFIMSVTFIAECSPDTQNDSKEEA